MLYRGDDPIQDRSTKNRPVFDFSSSFGEPQESLDRRSGRLGGGFGQEGHGKGKLVRGVLSRWTRTMRRASYSEIVEGVGSGHAHHCKLFHIK